MTLIETLIALTISTAVLVAVAAAFNASAAAIARNDEYFRCTQTARIAMDRLTTELRRADAVQVDAAGSSVQVIRPADQRDAGEIYREYAYDPAGKRLTFQAFFADHSGPCYEAAANVSEFHLGPVEMRANASGQLTPVRIPIALTCSIGQSAVKLSAAAAPRRTLGF